MFVRGLVNYVAERRRHAVNPAGRQGISRANRFAEHSCGGCAIEPLADCWPNQIDRPTRLHDQLEHGLPDYHPGCHEESAARICAAVGIWRDLRGRFRVLPSAIPVTITDGGG